MGKTSRPGKVIIIGAGPAGLCAGWKLTEKGVQVEVVEMEDQVGGLCRTIRRGDYIFDLGGHRFISKYPALLKDVCGIMGESMTLRPRKSQIRLKGKYYAYPLDAKDLIGKMSAFVAVKCFADYLWTAFKKRISPKDDISLEDWIVNKFGRSLYDICFGPYSEKLWGVPPAMISADWAAQRISLLNLWDVFLRLFGKKKDAPSTYAVEYFYPMKGIGQIPERIAEIITEGGGTVHLNSKVVRVLADDKEIKGVVIEKNGQEITLTGDSYVSTMPLPDFVTSLEPRVSGKYIEAAKGMRFRALRFMNICVDMEQVSDNTWIYIPEKKYIFFRIQEPKNWAETTAPKGKTSLILEISCDVGDELWTADDDVIHERCMADLKKLGFNIENKVLDYFSTYARHAYPIYSLNYVNLLKTTFELFRRYDNLVVCGRQGLYRYNNMDHSMMMGFITAEHILEGKPRSEILKIACEREVFETCAIHSYQPGALTTGESKEAFEGQKKQQVNLSVIIPVHNAANTLKGTLDALFASSYKNFEVILIDDASTDGALELAKDYPCRVLRQDLNLGPAAARNRGAAEANAEILLFADSDVRVLPDTLEKVVSTFATEPEISALFGSYTIGTPCQNFISTFKNLLHHYTHQTSNHLAASFWGACGAIRRKAFFAVNGFDEKFRRASIEDIELGYRLTRLGYVIRLAKEIQVIHCKRYTFLNLVKSDVFNRAIPWTVVMLKGAGVKNDLNTTKGNAVCVASAYLLPFFVVVSLFYPWMILAGVLCLLMLLLLNRSFYAYAYKYKGAVFMLGTIAMNYIFYLYSGVGLCLGILAYLRGDPK